MKDYCKYVDVFYGNGEVDHFADDGIGSKWYYIKALCGNTVPHATLPFGKMSVGAYSGGYPSGYGTHYPNSCGGIRKLGKKMTIRGFSHLHHSGTGGIKYYYNYAVVTPFYGSIDEIEIFRDFENERAVPGKYEVTFNNVDCKLTVNHNTAVHYYSFKNECGRIAVDFSNDGLHKLFGNSYYSFPTDCTVIRKGNDKVLFSGILSGIQLYFCVKVAAQNVTVNLYENNTVITDNSISIEKGINKFGGVFDFLGNSAKVYVSYSTVSAQEAENNVDDIKLSFEELSQDAYNIWNKHLSAIEIEADDDERKKFYSNFYHSIVKPTDMLGECILGIRGDVVGDISTFWDIYKTQLPLIFMLYPDMSQKIVRGIINISRALGKIPCSIGLTNIFPCEMQAKMLGIFALCDAYYAGVEGITETVIEECIERELQRDDYKTFLDSGVFDRYTHILDVADACYNVSKITKSSQLKAKLLRLYQNLENAYGAEGLLSENSEFYEGDRYTYSFRIHANMEDRIKWAGGKDKFEKMLDSFFGFGKESVIQPKYVGADKEISSNNFHRFQGFNNECDMETPYSYIYAGNHDKLCEIIHECVHRSFTLGRGGVPGNNDSGGLSSCYMWNALGLFPATGKGEFLLGTPCFKKTVIHMSNGKDLTITAENFDGRKYLVDNISFNNEPVEIFTLTTKHISKGGELKFIFK